MITVDRKARKLLLKADGLIGNYGWTRGQLGSKRVGFCLVGALEEADRSVFKRIRLVDSRRLTTALNAVRVCLLESGRVDADRGSRRTCTSWNDARGREALEVRQMLQSVAAGHCPEPPAEPSPDEGEEQTWLDD